jgi:hypothetical protein
MATSRRSAGADAGEEGIEGEEDELLEEIGRRRDDPLGLAGAAREAKERSRRADQPGRPARVDRSPLRRLGQRGALDRARKEPDESGSGAGEERLVPRGEGAGGAGVERLESPGAVVPGQLGIELDHALGRLVERALVHLAVVVGIERGQILLAQLVLFPLDPLLAGVGAELAGIERGIVVVGVGLGRVVQRRRRLVPQLHVVLAHVEPFGLVGVVEPSALRLARFVLATEDVRVAERAVVEHVRLALVLLTELAHPLEVVRAEARVVAALLAFVAVAVGRWQAFRQVVVVPHNRM